MENTGQLETISKNNFISVFLSTTYANSQYSYLNKMVFSTRLYVNEWFKTFTR